MDATTREAVESPLFQGTSEKIAYTLDTTPWGGSPENAAVAILDQDGTDVSEDHFEAGDCAVEGNIITFPRLINLAAGKKYKLKASWVSFGNEWGAFLIINGQN
jgi:hypothetical protein